MTLEELQKQYYKHNIFWPGGIEITPDDIGIAIDFKKLILDIITRIENLEAEQKK